MPDWIEILLRSILLIAAIVALTRLRGLRSFSKMSGFDFAITVSVGSILAGAVTTVGTSRWHYIIALACLFAIQFLLARLRIASDTAQSAIDNAPLLIMERGKPLPGNLEKVGMTIDDLYGKLREANAYEMKRVHAVVIETTGDVSVLHGDPDGPGPDEEILRNVRRS